MLALHIYSDGMSTGTLPDCLYGCIMRNVNKNDCAKSLRVVLLYGEFVTMFPNFLGFILLVCYRGDIN